MQCVVLAGGLGTRMRPITETVPKSLLPVLGRPFVDYQLDWFRAHGVEEVLFLTGHLGEKIQAHVGDGSRWGLRATFSREEGPLLGTAGSLRLAAERGLLHPHFLLTYGDSYLRVDFRAVYRAFLASEAPALMTVFRNQGTSEPSNVVFTNGRLECYDKKAPPGLQARMHFIDYGLLGMTERAIKNRLPVDQKADLSGLLADLCREQLLAGLEVQQRFYEIGSAEGLREMEDFLRDHQKEARRE